MFINDAPVDEEGIPIIGKYGNGGKRSFIFGAKMI